MQSRAAMAERQFMGTRRWADSGMAVPYAASLRRTEKGDMKTMGVRWIKRK